MSIIRTGRRIDLGEIFRLPSFTWDISEKSPPKIEAGRAGHISGSSLGIKATNSHHLGH